MIIPENHCTLINILSLLTNWDVQKLHPLRELCLDAVDVS